MKKNQLLFVSFFISVFTFSQNVGIGTTAPTNALHIVPNAGTDPLRVEGLNLYSLEDHLLIIDTATGLVKKMPVDSIVPLLGSIVDTDVDSMNYVNDTLYLYENSKIIKTEISSGSGGGLAGYDTVEYLTGKVWIDGKPVYERVIHNYTAPIPAIDLSSYFPPNYIQTLLEFRIISDCSGTPNNSVHHSSFGSFGYNVGTNNTGSNSNPNFSSCGGGTYTFILEYTKQ